MVRVRDRDRGMVIEGLAYTATPFDRAAALRTDPDWVTAQLARPDVRVVPVWRDRCLMRDGEPIAAADRAVLEAAGQSALLGLDDGVPVVAADLGTKAEDDAMELCGAEATADLRHIAGTVADSMASTMAYARGLLYWHRISRFCGSCGAPTESAEAGHARTCKDCARQLFPRIEPAVIALVEGSGRQPRCLLA